MISVFSVTIPCRSEKPERLTECLRLGQGLVPQVHAQVFVFARTLLSRMSAVQLTSLWPIIIPEVVSLCHHSNIPVVYQTAYCQIPFIHSFLEPRNARWIILISIVRNYTRGAIVIFPAK